MRVTPMSAPRARTGLVTTVLCTSLAVACVAPGPSQEQEAREAELQVRLLMAAWESADPALIEELFWPDALYDDFPNQHTYQGVVEITGYVTALHDWADVVTFDVGQVHVTESGAVAEWTFSAVQARPIGSQVPVVTGREVISNGVTIIELERGRIRRAADYMDTRPIALQLGGRLEMPGGSVIELDGR
jgi:hypothetical protein